MKPGLCECGCGQATPLAPQTVTAFGWIKGQPIRFITGHNFRRGTLEERFWSHVEPHECGCWLWTGTTAKGYGQIRSGGRMLRAHRVAYELLVGPIPEGLVIDHVSERGCLHRHCVNPEHLEPVTHSENSQRGVDARRRREAAA